MTNKIKYGLLEYHTENIGDEVQSIAARRFLPQIDYYFDRDNIDATKTRPDEKVKLIMNGWYTHHPENWPPQNPGLEPLLISIHVEQDALNGKPAKAFTNKKSVAFLNKFGPVGARNHPTSKLLEKYGVNSYFSGCVTLTLIPDPKVKKQNFILAVDVPDKVYQTMLNHTTRPIIRLDTNRKKDLDRETRFILAELWLYLYQSAHAVITTRLHTILPCLALGTPVLALSGRDPKRYKGLIDLANCATPNEYIKNPSIFNLDKPPQNPKHHIKLRKKLEKTCSNFTGYDSHNSYLNNKKISDLLSNPKLLQFFLNATFDTWALEESQHQVAHLEHQIQQLQIQPTTQSNILGIKDSTKSLIRAIKRRIRK